MTMINIMFSLTFGTLYPPNYDLIDYNTIRQTELSQQRQQFVTKETECLAKTIFLEARGESMQGQRLVAQTVLNRTKHPSFPKTVCGVVKSKLKGVCSFSSCSKWNNKIRDRQSYAKANKIARKALQGQYKSLTKALFFKVCTHESSFFNTLKLITTEQSHCFYTTYPQVNPKHTS
jgi:spore germination cell wall hydrolase CwlJ-like protein